MDGLKDRTITHNRRRAGETVSRSLQIDRHVHRASIELCRRRDVLVSARDVTCDGLAEAVAVEVDVDVGLLHAWRARWRRDAGHADVRRHGSRRDLRAGGLDAFPFSLASNSATLFSSALYFLRTQKPFDCQIEGLPVLSMLSLCAWWCALPNLPHLWLICFFAKLICEVWKPGAS